MSRKPDEWMPLHIGRYLANTAHLTRDQHGAYLLILFSYWTNGGPIDCADEQLAATARATKAEWKRLRPVIAKFFTEKDGKWHQKRADEELAKAKSITEARAEAGKRGGKAKANNLANTVANTVAKATPLPSTLTLTKEEDTSSLRSDVTRARKEPFQLPDWIPSEPWSAFEEMRRKIRAPLTERAMKLAVTSLEELHAAGEDVTAVLNQSVMRSWRGLFPVKQEGSHGHGRQNGTEGKQTRALGNFLEEARRETSDDAGGDATGAALASVRRALPSTTPESDDHQGATWAASHGDGRSFSAPEQHDGSGIDPEIPDFLLRSTWAV